MLENHTFTPIEVLTNAKLPLRSKDQSLLNESVRANEFSARLNQGELFPAGLDLSQPNAAQEVQEYEHCVTALVPPNPQVYAHQLGKLFVRFNPLPEEMPHAERNRLFVSFLTERGFDPKRDLLEQLQTMGSVFYFPVNLDPSGRLIVQKRYYFPKELQYEILTASEWELILPKERQILSQSRLTAIGLSVGSENVAAALNAGITRFDLTDPGKVHLDAQGRLGEFGFDPDFLGINKTVLTTYRIMERFPYAEIRGFLDGINTHNWEDIMQEPHPNRYTPDGEHGLWICSEEVDDFNGKRRSRLGFHQLPPNIPWHLFMLGDVGYRVTFFHEQAGDQPFHGMVAKLDPQKDQYGANMIDTYGELLPLFASVGGFDGIPEPLLSMMASGRIGKQPGTEITRVPQSREATLLSGAVFSGAIRMAARVEPIVPHHVFDLRQHLLNGQPNQDSIAQELSLQQQLNQKFFGQASLIE